MKRRIPGCRFPAKAPHTQAEAQLRADTLNRARWDGRPVHAFRCPGGRPPHWHVGHVRRGQR